MDTHECHHYLQPHTPDRVDVRGYDGYSAERELDGVGQVLLYEEVLRNAAGGQVPEMSAYDMTVEIVRSGEVVAEWWNGGMYNVNDDFLKSYLDHPWGWIVHTSSEQEGSEKEVVAEWAPLRQAPESTILQSLLVHGYTTRLRPGAPLALPEDEGETPALLLDIERDSPDLEEEVGPELAFPSESSET